MKYSKKKKNIFVFVANHLFAKIKKLNRNKKKEVIVTWSRSSGIMPIMIGHTIAVHNGKEHIPIYITYRMIGRKLGDFVPTRTFEKHTEKKDNRSRRQSIEKPAKKQNDNRSRRQQSDNRSRRQQSDNRSRRQSIEKPAKKQNDNRSRRQSNKKY
uniref:Small ribosomal subunit protein uS19c n=1 Tax=Zantedeschia aethiopica TaxID=69721 RepID=A0A6B9TYT3_ZANAE|nr:ribosomal protein S19 [Zantedeschia aethiopica]QJF46807.1 ribosomal protein S19 [Zantedeschia aethiopica]